VSRPVTALLLLALTACGGNKASGAVALAVCDGTQVCNAESGFCESNPCGPGCGSSRHCDTWGPVPRCVDDSAPADLVQQPPPPPSLPIAAPIP